MSYRPDKPLAHDPILNHSLKSVVAAEESVQSNEGSKKRAFPKGAKPLVQDIVSSNEFKIRPLQPDRYYLTHNDTDRCLHFINRNNAKEYYSFTVGKHIDIAQAELLKRRYISQHPNEWQDVQRIAQGKKRGRRKSTPAQPIRRSEAVKGHAARQCQCLCQCHYNHHLPADSEVKSTKTEPPLEPLVIEKDASFLMRLTKAIRERRIYSQEIMDLCNQHSIIGLDAAAILDMLSQIVYSVNLQQIAQSSNQPPVSNSEQKLLLLEQQTRLNDARREEMALRRERILLIREQALAKNQAADDKKSELATSEIKKLEERVSKIEEKVDGNWEFTKTFCSNSIEVLQRVATELADVKSRLPKPLVGFEKVEKAIDSVDRMHKVTSRPSYSELVRNCADSYSHSHFRHNAASMTAASLETTGAGQSSEKAVEGGNTGQETQNQISSAQTEEQNKETMVPLSLVKQTLQEESNKIAAVALDAAKDGLLEEIDKLVIASNGEAKVDIELMKQLINFKLGKTAANLRSGKSENECSFSEAKQ